MNAMPKIVSNSAHKPGLDLFVDLDGTLIAGDIAEESLARASREPWALYAAVRAYSGQGLSGLKRSLAETTPPDVQTLPYRPEVLEYIKAAKAEGRRVFLATAADKRVAQDVADHLDVFDGVIASEPGRNLKGEEKLRAIQDMAQDDFEYLGDSSADMPIWDAAAKSGYVAASATANRHMAQNPASVSLHVARQMAPAKALIKAMRPHQWAKNALVFVPILFAHQYTDPAIVLAGLLAFVCFSFCASGVYLLNDIIDIQADRQHATKKNRPFAAGHLSIRRGLLAASALLIGSAVASFIFVNMLFGMVLVGYAILTSAYTFWLKSYSTVDVIALSLLYTVRILAGSAATYLAPSPWLLSYSLFFFLSLAYMKRYIELDRMNADTEDGKLPSRNYYASELQLVMAFGIANGALSVLTLTQYVNTKSVTEHYTTPFLLWLIVPVMMYWTYRSWTWASRGKVGDDPVLFAIKDKVSRLCVAIVLLIMGTARLVDFPGITQ
jgi:4-hydroxybenzoate polyprenyltransferase